MSGLRTRVVKQLMEKYLTKSKAKKVGVAATAAVGGFGAYHYAGMTVKDMITPVNEVEAEIAKNANAMNEANRAKYNSIGADIIAEQAKEELKKTEMKLELDQLKKEELNLEIEQKKLEIAQAKTKLQLAQQTQMNLELELKKQQAQTRLLLEDKKE